MSESIHLISVLGIIGKSEYVSYDFDDSGARSEFRRYPFDPQAIPTDLNDIIEEGFTRNKMHVILDLGNIPWMNSNRKWPSCWGRPIWKRYSRFSPRSPRPVNT